MGVCYDGVEGLLYLSLFSLLAACALSAMLCVIFRLWTLMGSRSVPSQLHTPLCTACNVLLQKICSLSVCLPSYPFVRSTTSIQGKGVQRHRRGGPIQPRSTSAFVQPQKVQHTQLLQLYQQPGQPGQPSSTSSVYF